MAKGTVGNYLGQLAPDVWREVVLDSPADVFGLAASVLVKTGAYLAVVSHWPPIAAASTWHKEVRRLGEEWQNQWREDSLVIPTRIAQIWQSIVDNADIPLHELFNLQYADIANPGANKAAQVCQSLLEAMAIADEACLGIGIPGNEPGFSSKLEKWAAFHLQRQFNNRSPSTLCRHIDPIDFSVLPKLHTPQTGITLRSLSHNLCLLVGTEVRVRWAWGADPKIGDTRHGLNLLLVPWPTLIRPVDFSACEPRCGDLPTMELTRHGFFRYNIRSGEPWDARAFRELIERAQHHVGRIDAVVLPELALKEQEISIVAQELLKCTPRPPMLITGAAIPAPGDFIRNTSITLIPQPTRRTHDEFQYSKFEQAKHHRWRLDSRQISQYGLGGMLDPLMFWWENSTVPRRELGFISMNPWLTLCTLLCEDLARPDPISDIVRAVGPNLIIALLMDGPQLAKRWPARYGTVLADDPGSSVLTVTNLGMAELCRPHGASQSRVIALWKDAHCGEPIEVVLPPNRQAVVACITRERSVEFSADGRSDEGASAHLSLSGIHPI